MKRWSPISFAGKVYEFNRGVICIGERQTEKYSLDRGIFHHGDATIIAFLSLCSERFTLDANTCKIISSYADKPFEAGTLAASSSNVLIQLEGDEVLLFLPDSINEYQVIELYNIVEPRKSFHFSLYHMGNVYDNISYEGIMKIIKVYALYLIKTQTKDKSYKKD